MVDYKETDLSKRKHADFMLSIAGKVAMLVFGVLLGATSKTWIAVDKLSDLGFRDVLSIGIVGGLGIYIMVAALKRYASLGQVNTPDHSVAVTVSGAQNSHECLDAEKPICIVIERGATKISIRIE